nr:RNA-directed DNA polymerase, eukaryota [Tanacetum cinerariifolium]
MKSFGSKEDQVNRISKSVFVTNFPDSFGSRDLWSLCEVYCKVVDVFIPNRKSKADKRFAFVRFIRVEDMERLIGNLCTLWVGRFHLHANVVRYERPPKPSPSVRLPSVKSLAPFSSTSPGSYVNVMKDINEDPVLKTPGSCSSVLVLDDTCVNAMDLSRHIMGRTKEVNSIPNLRFILTNEGFSDVQLSYLGGLWPASHDFVCNERIVWVDIEGVPLHIWSSATFSGIGKKWGTVMDIEESPGSSFARKRLCIKTSMAYNILETFKVIFKGKVFSVRAKELFTWSPCFLEYKDPGYISEDESILGANNNLKNVQHSNDNLMGESDVDEVSDTIFKASPQAPCDNVHDVNAKENSQHSDDPFGFYDLLRKPINTTDNVEDPSLSLPPGFTPTTSHQENNNVNSDHHEVNQGDPSPGKDGMIKVGRSMGYEMDGCSKDIEYIIASQGVDDVVIYAPQSFALKRILWDYISGLINRWNRDTIVLGDFNDVKMEGYSFTWSYPMATKMSKLDRFLVSEGIFVTFPTISAVCLDRHLSDHRPILLNEIHSDYGPTPFRVYHFWFKREGFDVMVEHAWRSFTHNDSNWMIRFKKKLQDLKKIIRVWIRESNAHQGDENSKVFHGVINKRRSQLAIRGVFVSGDCMPFPNRLSPDQIGDLDNDISLDEDRKAVWDCGESKSPGPDGFTFEFFRRYWHFIGSDFRWAVNCYFDKGCFSRGGNSSFIALIPKVMDAKFVFDSVLSA